MLPRRHDKRRIPTEWRGGCRRNKEDSPGCACGYAKEARKAQQQPQSLSSEKESRNFSRFMTSCGFFHHCFFLFCRLLYNHLILLFKFMILPSRHPLRYALSRWSHCMLGPEEWRKCCRLLWTPATPFGCGCYWCWWWFCWRRLGRQGLVINILYIVA